MGPMQTPGQTPSVECSSASQSRAARGTLTHTKLYFTTFSHATNTYTNVYMKRTTAFEADNNIHHTTATAVSRFMHTFK